ncbi:MAG: hypothetical protein ABS78_18905 [Phenylobacterium sp. SCN 70-31]|jgi:hypothetical protein|nr:MAG: hypothetical protein ABS78_18905 [Phenylobacterium sp. SCN 70-31]
MPPRSSSPLPPSQEDLEFVQAARRFNATGAIWPSTVLPPRSRALAKEGDQENWLFEIHERSCRALGWHLSGAMRRHSNPLKVVTSFVAGVCNPRHAELGALGSVWSLPESRRRHVQGAFQELANRLASVLEAGRSAGAIRSCDCLIASQLILGLVLWTPVAVCQAPPRKLLNGRRLVEGLQDLVLYGRSGGGPEAHRLSQLAHNFLVGDQGDPLQCLVSRTINRAGAEAVTAAFIASELPCSEMEANQALRRLHPVIDSCQQRALALVLELRDHAFGGSEDQRAGFAAFMCGLAEAYLRDDVQPLSPLAISSSVGPCDAVRVRWRAIWELLRQRQVEGVAKQQVRERFYDLSPIFVSAICAFLCSGLWTPSAKEAGYAAREVAALTWLGLAPPVGGA